MNESPEPEAPLLQPSDWIAFVEREYLAAFVRDGGATIKFVVPFDDDARVAVAQAFLERAVDLGYVVATVSAKDTKVHMVEELFFRVAQAVPWKDLSERVIVKLAGELGYQPPIDGQTPLFLRIAAANGLEPSMVQVELRKKVQGRVFLKRKFAKDFRVVMTHLCLATLAGGAEADTDVQILTDWLTGRNRLVSPVKPYQIHCRIRRANARYLLESLLRWVRFAGKPGVAVLLDLGRLAVARNPHDGAIFYSRWAMLDAYEVLRQFIDSTDQLDGCFMLVLADVGFLDPDHLGRGFGAYKALKERVGDEVRDRRLVNPMTSLARLSSAGKRVAP